MILNCKQNILFALQMERCSYFGMTKQLKKNDFTDIML